MSDMRIQNGAVLAAIVVCACAGCGRPPESVPIESLKISAAEIPSRPEFLRLPDGEQMGTIGYESTGPGGRTVLRVVLPAGEHKAGSLGCVLVPPAGTPLFTGMELDDASYKDETYPYVEHGFAVVHFSLDGPVQDLDTVTNAELSHAYRQFVEASAGMANVRYALEFVKARLPEVAPSRIYIAGHSSAGTLSLLAAEFGDIAGCVAYAPDTNPYKSHSAEEMLRSAMAPLGPLPGLLEFDKEFSPIERIKQVQAPVFIFQAKDDFVCNFSDAKRYVEQLDPNNTTFVTVPSGGHFDAVKLEGIPAGVKWLAARDNQLQGFAPKAPNHLAEPTNVESDASATSENPEGG